ncbi:MAG: 2-C-methyl-D-erythritol 2,4-cyclodiphosphate synthase [Dehalococcoidia bacterium]|nr:MAG: 2-C-methyl-D-erythritol 2,4-cyclodiphosphate synthase [Dehalococcoidia bacterium]
MRIGIGYDVHPLVEGRPLVLGGVRVPFERGLSGYSDADVLVHAIIDALLGAAALGDIGTHFPDSEPQYKDISSIVLLRRAGEMLHQGYKIENIDATIIAEQPKLAPFIDEMRQNIGDALGIAKDRVSVKASTSASLGFAGRGEGIAAHAVALIERRKDEGL